MSDLRKSSHPFFLLVVVGIVFIVAIWAFWQGTESGQAITVKCKNECKKDKKGKILAKDTCDVCMAKPVQAPAKKAVAKKPVKQVVPEKPKKPEKPEAPNIVPAPLREFFIVDNKEEIDQNPALPSINTVKRIGKIFCYLKYVEYEQGNAIVDAYRKGYASCSPVYMDVEKPQVHVPSLEQANTYGGIMCKADNVVDENRYEQLSNAYAEGFAAC